MATAIDTDHLHSHLVVDGVSFQDGRKLHQSAADLQTHRIANDEICVHTMAGDSSATAETESSKADEHQRYRSAAKGELEVPAYEHHRPVHAVRCQQENLSP